MERNIQLSLPLGKVCGKKVCADFDGGSISSDGGVMFVRMTEERIGIIRRIFTCLKDMRHQEYIDHSYHDMLRQRVYQICCGYEDANDCDELRKDPVLKTACDRLPIDGADLASQPTMSRLENVVRRTELYRMGIAFVDCFVASYSTPPEGIILDIDDTDDPTHGTQQLSLFNSYYREYCYLPLHIYEGRSGKLITAILRPGRRPNGKEIVSIIKRVVKRIRQSWPNVKIFLRGDAHFSAPEVHDWCENNNVYFVLGQSGNRVLHGLGVSLMEQARKLYNESGEKVRLFKSFSYKASSWSKPRRIVSKAEVTKKGENSRYVVTSLESSQPSFIYDNVYCSRGKMENFIKDHKTYLHSERTSCHEFTANQFRLFLHSAAYVLLHALAKIGLKGTEWSKAQFDTIQKRILKVGTRVRELATRIKFHFPTCFPLKKEFIAIITNLAMEPP